MMIKGLPAREYYASYREAHRQEAREYAKRHYAANRERAQNESRLNYRKNFERRKITSRAWSMANPEKRRTYQKRWRSKTHLPGVMRRRITDSLRQRMKKVLFKNGKSASTLKLLGCSVDDLRIYLESKFESGMCWENYGKVWDIDHIMPCAIFDLSKTEHQRRCFHFSNLQPLFEDENHKKGTKVPSAQFNLL